MKYIAPARDPRAKYVVEIYASHAPSLTRQAFAFTVKREAERCASRNRRRGYVVDTNF
jgi:hypothetical protein